MELHPGQRVVCIDDSTSGRYVPPGWIVMRYALDGLTRGRIYTVREVGYLCGQVPICRLMEIVRRFDEGQVCEGAFAQARFRPIKEVSTDIGFAHEILNTVTSKEDA